MADSLGSLGFALLNSRTVRRNPPDERWWMRIFLDANVLFSAAKSDGAVREPIHSARSPAEAFLV